MRRIELKRAKRYTDMKTGKMFVASKMYTVGDQLAKRLLDQTDARDDPYFRDHGEITKTQVNEMLAAQEAKKAAAEVAKREAELAEMGSELLDDPDPVADNDAFDSATEAEGLGDEEVAEV